MNLFRLLGDLSHLASIFILLQKISKSRSCRGISFKTQLIYLIVFLTRSVLCRPRSLKTCLRERERERERERSN